MSIPFAHPSGQRQLGIVSDAFRTKKVFQRKDRHIVFVCGGPVRVRSRSMRYRFLKYSQKSLSQYRFFLAEAATKDLIEHNEPQFINLVDFESLVAQISDCIILFLESPGSIGELGYFVNTKETVKKLLVINDVKKQKDSFINNGLLDKVNEKSAFKAIIWLDRGRPDFLPVKKRLETRLPAKQGKRFKFEKFSKLRPQQQLYVVFQILHIFGALRFESLVYCLKHIFEGFVKESRVRHLVSVLVSIEYLERAGDDLQYFIPARKAEPFLEFRNYDVRDLRARTINFFKMHHFETYQLLAETAS